MTLSFDNEIFFSPSMSFCTLESIYDANQSLRVVSSKLMTSGYPPFIIFSITVSKVLLANLGQAKQRKLLIFISWFISCFSWQKIF